jgi:hypothetical protein
MNTAPRPPMPPPLVEREIRLRWNGPQARAMQSDTLYLDLEGAIRSGKTTVLVWKAVTQLAKFPGMHALLCRWTGDSLDAQLKPRFWELCPPELLTTHPWNAKEEFVQFGNGSRCYLRALKTGEDSAKFAKSAGLTLAFIGVDQAEEIPKEQYEYLKGRLSQKGYPRQLMLTPNPPEHHHWLAQEFPREGVQGSGLRECLTIATLDNAHNLPDGYIDELMNAYPPGHPMRRRLLEGKRGLTMTGEPIYGKIFKPEIHIKPQVLEPEEQLLRAWDFGHSSPAILWGKMTPGGGFRTLGEMQGRSQFLEDFIPQVLSEERKRWGQVKDVLDCCDPTGAQPTSHGTKRTAVMILHEYGIYPLLPAKGNDPQVRDYAIQTLARLMLRLLPEGPAYQADPSCVTLTDGNTSGYVWNEKLMRGTLRVPKKDGYYDHLQNCQEYLVLTFLIGQVAEPPEDEDEEDEPPRRLATNRAGY